MAESLTTPRSRHAGRPHAPEGAAWDAAVADWRTLTIGRSGPTEDWGDWTSTFDKLVIARRYIVPRQLKENGLKATQCKWTDAGIKNVIEFYSREAGGNPPPQLLISFG